MITLTKELIIPIKIKMPKRPNIILSIIVIFRVILKRLYYLL